MKITLRVWRQASPKAPGALKTYQLTDVEESMSFLEMLDMLNEELTARNEEPVAFDSDCREGICGMCGIVINGAPHGRYNSKVQTTTCQLYMRNFKDGDVIDIEPWKAGAFPNLKDLIVDRSAFDRIIQAGGFISVNAGAAPEAHSVPAPKRKADAAFDNATCIGCGACVAACPNGAAMLFTSAKVTHLGRLPQGQPERMLRIKAMIAAYDEAGFGGCQNIGECAAVCPKSIPLASIGQLNRDLMRSMFTGDGK